MTIKELENRTGMTRANIRFYEGEGLVFPKRLENGYRDYSEEDALTLEKIKLLRQLQMDIDTIRKVQQGVLTLEQALFSQVAKLEGDRTVIERAVQVCRELERSGVEYAALEPQSWLRQLQAPERPQLPEAQAPASKTDKFGAPRACYHPWQRLFARSLDVTLYSTAINVAWLLLTRDPGFLRLQSGGPVAEFLSGLASLVLALALEPLWLRFWGWTPGKWVFGLTLRNEDGDKLTLAQGFQRSYAVFRDGYGWYIPIWGWWKMWQARKLGLEQGQDCYWDHDEGYRYTKAERRFSGGGLDYTEAERGAGGGWLFVGLEVLCMAALVLTMLWSAVPPCRGDLTVAEFARNYNHSLRIQTAGSDSYEPTLDGEGRWKEREASIGETVIFFDDTSYTEPEFTVTDGRVTAVRLHMESRYAYVGSGFREAMAVMALVGSADGVTMFNVLRTLEEAYKLLGTWENLETDFRGLHISQQAEYIGYEDAGSGTLWLEDAKTPRHCEKTVTISLIEP